MTLTYGLLVDLEYREQDSEQGGDDDGHRDRDGDVRHEGSAGGDNVRSHTSSRPVSHSTQQSSGETEPQDRLLGEILEQPTAGRGTRPLDPRAGETISTSAAESARRNQRHVNKSSVNQRQEENEKLARVCIFSLKMQLSLARDQS